MSTATAREKLRAALAGLGGDTQALLYPPPVPSSGQAWPQWVMTDVGGYCAFTHTFEVYVVVGGVSPQTTAQNADALLERLVDVLAEVSTVVQVEPTLLTLTDNPNGLPCLRARVETT